MLTDHLPLLRVAFSLMVTKKDIIKFLPLNCRLSGFKVKKKGTFSAFKPWAPPFKVTFKIKLNIWILVTICHNAFHNQTCIDISSTL